MRRETPAATQRAPSREAALLLLARFAPRARPWGWSRLVLGARGLPRARGLRFAKVLGSGARGGFGLRPSGSIIGLFCLFDDAGCVEAFRRPHGPLQPWFDHAQECFSVALRAYSARGSWAGHGLSVSSPVPPEGPIASLTRASIRPARAVAFWRMQPPAEHALATARGCRLAVGLGEAPVLRQATFSIWDDVSSMDRFARAGAHRDAIEAARARDFFSESMFVRFVVQAPRGSWQGRAIA